MDTQDRSILDPPPEIPRDLSLKGTTTDEAPQDGCSLIEEVHGDECADGSTNYEACQDSRGPIKDEPTSKVNEMHRSFFVAALKGDWKDVKEILEKNPKAMTAEVITVNGVPVTVLHVAIIAAHDQLVENLIKRWPKEYEKKVDLSFFLETAAARGSKRMVKALMDKFHYEPSEVSDALCRAATHAPVRKEVIWYLAMRTKEIPYYSNTMRPLIKAGHFDLASTESYHRSGARLDFWGKYIYKCIPLCLVATSMDSEEMKLAPVEHFKISLWNLATKSAPFIKKIGELKLRHKCSLEFANLAIAKMRDHKMASCIVLDAASRGIFEIVKLCLKHFPELTWDEDFTEELIKTAVKGWHVELFRLLNAHNTMPFLTDERSAKRDMMEAVIKWPPECVPTDVTGAAFRMQSELQWFKVLQDRSDASFKSQKFMVVKDKSDPSSQSLISLDDPSFKERNAKTHRQLFEEGRKDLLKEAGEWTKDTSSSCSVVATLIIAIVFAVAFAVPGGNDGSKGIPIFLKKGSFMVFAVADALALFSSVTATLMFLAILTSRYAIDDFLHSLPRKLIMGLTFLFLSLAFMLVAFGSALVIVLGERLKWIYIPITLLAAFPVVLFAILQLPLYVEMVESTYRPRLYRPMKLWK